jgi:alkylation response protein AidB-like acyl-CoA dehydrogenase
MDFSFNEEQTMLQETVRRFVARDYGFAARHQITQTASGFSRDVWQGFADLGLLALQVPEADEGLGGGPFDTLLVMGAMGEGLVLEPYLSSAVIATHAIARLGNAIQREVMLSSLASGDLIAVLAHDEQTTRFDRLQIATRAQKTATGYTLDGHKQVIVHGGSADILLVSAMLDGALKLFAVPCETAGVVIQRYKTVDSVPAADITLTAVQLPASALLDGAGDTEAALADVLDLGLAALCAEAVGALDKLLAATVEYARNRKQFGQPIGKFQALQHRMADMVLHIEQARSMSYLAAVRCQDADLALRAQALSAAKVVIGQACRFVGQQAVQLHGGMGVTDELDVSHYFKRLMAIELQAGCTDLHLENFARALAA